MRLVFPVDGFTAVQLGRYADVCGWTLARAHARSGDAATLSGYLGQRDNIESAIAQFALAYADQTEQDHALLVEAARSGASRPWSKRMGKRRGPIPSGDRGHVPAGGFAAAASES